MDEFALAEKVVTGSIDIYKIFREYVVFLDVSGYEPKSIKTSLAAVKGYLRHLGIKIYSEDFRHNVRMPKNIMRKEEALTKEMLLRLLRNSTPRLQTVRLVAVSTGMRIGEIVQLEIRDIDFEHKPTKIRIRAETTKTREERETFLTEEATNSLKDYLTRYYNWKEGEKNEYLKNQVIFGSTSLPKCRAGSNDKPKRSAFLRSENLLQKALFRQIRRIGDLSKNNENGRKVIYTFMPLGSTSEQW
ncbi:MAG TPA: tyrosine-type recombinase/integrase [Candidatus Nitrosotalea sp.]|nr:tyrosine-type recombinase/integrase [Candidatus Nitrosotalea sp.]